MFDCIITVRSVTPAQRGERLLHRAGIDCALGRTSRKLEEQGCGYGLQLGSDRLPEALALLRRENVPIRKVYRMDREMGLQEWKL